MKGINNKKMLKDLRRKGRLVIFPMKMAMKAKKEAPAPSQVEATAKVLKAKKVKKGVLSH